MVSHDSPTPHNLHPQAVYAALPNSILIAASADSQRWSPPDITIDFEQVTLLVWEADFSLLVEASFLEITCKSKSVSHVPLHMLVGKRLTFRCRPSVPASPFLSDCRRASSNALRHSARS